MFVILTINVTFAATLEIEINELNSSNGLIKLHLFKGQEGFPTKGKKALQTHLIPIVQKVARITISNISQGEYAISYFHDENSNGKMNTNWLGLPAEGFGFSNNAMNMLSAPSYEDCKFQILDSTDNKMVMTIRYSL